MSIRRLQRLATALTLLVGVTACANTPGGDADGKLQIVAAFYPFEFVAKRIGGDKVSVRNLVKPGAEPHDLELSPSQVAAVAEADLVVYLHGFQPAVDEAVDSEATEHALDAAGVQPLRSGFVPLEEGELKKDEEGQDPHIWLDPTRLASIADAVAKRLGDVDKKNAATFTANARTLRTELEALDSELKTGLSTCRQKTFVVSHNAFGYLANRYGLEQLPITGLAPDAEPSPGRLLELTKFARERHVRVIFFETLVSDKIAKTLANEVGAEAKVLDPIEGLKESSSADYFSAMRTNLGSLRAALDCQ